MNQEVQLQTALKTVYLKLAQWIQAFGRGHGSPPNMRLLLEAYDICEEALQIKLALCQVCLSVFFPQDMMTDSFCITCWKRESKKLEEAMNASKIKNLPQVAKSTDRLTPG